jgi:diacylglycerol kinase
MGLKENKYKSKNIFYSFKYAFEGLLYGFRTARNLLVDLFVSIAVMIFGIILGLSTIEWIIIVLCFGLVISLELCNSAIEEVVDMFTQEYNIRAKRAKDLAAGAVLFSALMTAIVGIIIFIPKIIGLF